MAQVYTIQLLDPVAIRLVAVAAALVEGARSSNVEAAPELVAAVLVGVLQGKY